MDAIERMLTVMALLRVMELLKYRTVVFVLNFVTAGPPFYKTVEALIETLRMIMVVTEMISVVVLLTNIGNRGVRDGRDWGRERGL